MKVSWSWFTNLHLPGERIKKLAFSLLHYEAGAGRCSCPVPVFRLGEVSLLGPRSDRALLMNTVQTVPYYSDHWRELAGELLFFDPRGIDWERDRIHGLQLRRGVGGGVWGGGGGGGFFFNGRVFFWGGGGAFLTHYLLAQ